MHTLDELALAFPAGKPMPALLTDFYRWYSTQRRGAIGSFELGRYHVSETFWLGGNELAEHFACFASLRNGDLIAFWFDTPERDASHAPIVCLSHDDAPYVLAIDFCHFLHRVAAGDKDLPNDLFYDEGLDDATDARPQLRSWLSELGIAKVESDRLDALSDQLESFVERHASLAKDQWQGDALAAQIAEILRPYWLRWVSMSELFGTGQDELPEHLKTQQDARVPKVELLDVQIANGLFELTRLDNGESLAVSEAASVADLFRELRERDAQRHPARGLWFAATLTLGEHGEFDLRRDYRTLPAFQSRSLIDIDQAIGQDLRRFPRAPFWQPYNPDDSLK